MKKAVASEGLGVREIFLLIDNYFTMKYDSGYSPSEYHRKQLAKAIYQAQTKYKKELKGK